MNEILNQFGQINNETQQEEPQTVKLDIEKSVNELTLIDGKEVQDPDKESENPEL